jgi:hypothetical protein
MPVPQGRVVDAAVIMYHPVTPSIASQALLLNYALSTTKCCHRLLPVVHCSHYSCLPLPLPPQLHIHSTPHPTYSTLDRATT